MLKYTMFELKNKLAGLFLGLNSKKNQQQEKYNDNSVLLLDQLNYFYDDMDEVYHHESINLHV